MQNIFSVRFIKIFLGIILTLILFFFAAPHIINLNKYSSLLAKEFEHRTGYELQIKGNITVSMTSEIKIILPDVLLISKENNEPKVFMSVKSIVATLDIHNFFLRRRVFNVVEFNEAIIDSTASSNLPIIRKHFNIKRFFIRNSQLNNEMGFHYSNFNMSMRFNSDGFPSISANFNVKDRSFDIDANVKGGDSDNLYFIDLEVASEGVKSKLSTKLTYVEEKVSFIGNLNMDINDASVLVDYFSNTFPFLSTMKTKTIDSPISILADVNYNNQLVQANNIKVSSNTIKGDGEVNFTIGRKDADVKVIFNLNSINMDKLFSYPTAEDFEDLSSNVFVDESYLNIDDIENTNSFIKINLGELVIRGVPLTNVSFNIDIENKNIKNGSLDFEIDSNDNKSSFNVSNMVLKDLGLTTILLGDFKSEGKDLNSLLGLLNIKDYLSFMSKDLEYSLDSKIMFSASEISLFNILGNIGEEGEKFIGNFTIQQNTIDHYNLNLEFQNVKLDEFDFPLFKSRLSSLLFESNQDDYLSKFIWFRKIPAVYAIKFIFNETEYNNNKIDNLAIAGDFAPSSMKVKGLIKSPFANGEFSLDLNTLSIKPSVKLKINGDSLDYNALVTMMSNILQKDQANDLSNSSNSSNPEKFTWSDKEIDVFRIEKYNSSFEIEIKNFDFFSNKMDNFRLYAHTSGNVLYLDNLDFDIYNGHFLSTGNISFFDKLLYQFSISASNIESKDLFTNTIPAFRAISGPISFTSSFIAQGDTPKEIVSSLNISSNLASSAIVLEGIDADTVVDVTLQRQEMPKDKILPALDKALNSGSTNLNAMSGNLTCTNGIFKSDNITFKTRFNSAISVFALDLNNFTLSSRTQLLFMPYEGNVPLSYILSISGDIRDSNQLQTSIEDEDVVKYIKSSYGIVTKEDIIAEKKARKEKKKEAINPIEDLNNKSYLYYKLLEQNSDQSLQ